MTGPVERFEAKYIPEPNSGCWLWEASVLGFGYGAFRLAGRTQRAHRVSYQLYVGKIPNGLFVLHKCDVPACVNPAHLFLGTPADNMADRLAKGRAPRGEAIVQGKLTETLVIAIRSDRRLQRIIASEYGVTQSTVSDVKSGKLWAHISVAQ